MISVDNKILRRDSDLEESDEKERLIREAGGMHADDGKDFLRADVMGSIAGADPSSPGYLGKINSLVTAHGAVDRLPATTMGATNQPRMRPPTETMAVPGGDPGMASGASLTPTALPPEGRAEMAGPPLMGVAKKPGLLGRIGQVASRMGNIAGDILAPGVMMNIPGTDLNKRMEANRAERKAETEQKLGIEQERADTEAAKEKREADAAGQPKPKEEKWTVMKDVAGPNGEILEEEENSGEVRVAPGSQGAKKQETGKQTFEEQEYAEWAEKQRQAGKPTDRMTFEKERAATTQKPERPEKPQRQLGVTPDGKVIEITPGMTLQPGTKPLGGELSATLKSEQGEEAGKSAQQYAKDYLDSKNFTGPGDEALMEKFFELAKPSSGFRMTHAQIEMLRNAQSWRNSAAAFLRHATVGTWFSDTQRQQIVDTMGNLQKARDEVKPNAKKEEGGEIVIDLTTPRRK